MRTGSRFLALIALITVTLGVPAATQRLPRNVIPSHYALWFAPDLDKETFRGRETIRVDLTTPARTITLHAAEIVFTEVSISAGGRIQAARVAIDAHTETAALTVSEEMPAGPAEIRIAYTGLLNDKLRGFYLSRANGRKYAITQMEATDARRAFPSFDEPDVKATFDISLTIDANDTAISNGAPVSDVPGPEPGTHTVTFARTPRMPTYLVAMIVGDFVCQSGAAGGTTVRVCSTPDKRALAHFALEAAEQQLAFYNDYSGIKYAFGKLDLIGVPDFAAGAMENAGAITFRDQLLLIEPERASLGTQKRVAFVVSHEIAHQWFGDLVTMKWWNDIWLNEGFATWMEHKPVARWRPDWKVELDDAQDTQSALAIDALRTTRPIRISAETPDEINEVFDGIAYEKTAGVLRMLESFVGADRFRKGVASYLKKYAFSNAAGEDFWNEMTRVTGRPIDRILKTYVEQPGAPVITVQTQCVGRDTSLTLAQQRFAGSPDGAAAGAPQLWSVPVCFKAHGNQTRCEVLDRPRQTFRVPGCGPIFANADARGYYFTEYPPETVRTLASAAGTLEPAERISLLGDEWWMVRAGRHDIGVYLDLAAAFSTDQTPAVLDAVAGRLRVTGEEFVPSAAQDQYQRWIRDRFGSALRTVGMPGSRTDTDEQQSRRAELLELVGITGNDATIQQQARGLAQDYMRDPASVSATLAPSVLRVAAASGDVALYDAYVARMQTLAATPDEYYRFFSALSSFRDPALTERTLAFALSPQVRTQDVGGLIAGVMSQPWSRDASWSFVKTHWDELTQKLGVFQGIPSIIGVLGSFCSTAAAADVRQFFAAHPVPSSERSLLQSTERIENCVSRSTRQTPALVSWLTSLR